MKYDSRHAMGGALTFALLIILLLTAGTALAAPAPQADNPNPPERVVKLIFIHHSTGENWIRDDYGGLGRALGENNYFVSDINYGWGPDAIGDRTDIPNWTEWFASEGTPRYMEALFNESGQNADYTRTLADPGGENEIIVFKSCFPNSELEGNPDDPPDPEGWLTVGHVKWVYNEILRYFGTRSDKLFVVITAPPVSDDTYAEKARAFNDWLLNDWLRENNYPLNNVAVFDFYNVLTDPNAHHRVNNGQVEHIATASNTLYYPSEDDHPSAQGSRKASDEFVPLLNIFYHRWQEGSAQLPPVEAPPAAAGEQSPIGGQPLSDGWIDDFESIPPADTSGWQAYWDEATPTAFACAPASGNAHSGDRALRMDFDVAANSWATCALFYNSPQDWSAAEGLTFYLNAAEAGLVFNVDIYVGSPESRETYLYTIEAPPDSAAGWIPIELRWADFHRADWEADAGAAFGKPGQVSGMAFGFSTYPDAPNTGLIWIDDLRLLGGEGPAEAEAEPPAEQPEGARRRGLPCLGALVLPLFLVVLARRKPSSARRKTHGEEP